MLIRLFRWLRGYLEISVDGGIAERFLSICGRRDILLWNMKPGRSMKACILAADFKRIRGAAFKSSARVTIEKRKGLPFLLKRYRKRKVFLAGLVLFLAALYLLSSLVWKIEVIGVEKTDLFALNRILKENGIKKWVWSRSIDEEKVRFEVLQQLNTVAWVGVRVKGTDVTVEIKERTLAPQMIPADQPCHLVSAKDGVIELMLVREGEAQVKVGDTVTKGQLLVSALKGVEVEQPLPVHSFGEVIARTWTQKSRTVPLILEKRELTGQQKSRYGIKISKIFINFFGNTGNIYPECDTIEETVWNTGGVSVIRRTVRELSVTRQELTEEEAAQRAEEEMTQELSAEVPEGTELVSVSREIQAEENGEIKVSCTFECLENIALQQTYEPELQGDLIDDTENSDSEQH